MATQTLEIVVRMRNIARRGLSRLGGQLEQVRQKAQAISASVFSLRNQLVGLAGSVGVGLLAKDFINAAAAFENYRTRLVRVLGSVEEGNRLFAEMRQLAKESTAEYADIMASATNLAGIMEGGVDEVKQYMKIIDDLAAVTGLGIQETTSQVIRMYSAGAASADLFRERGVLAMLGFQAGVSYSAEETRKRLIAAWEDPSSKIRNASLDLSNTYQGLMGMIADEWGEFQVNVMDSGVFDYLKATLQTVIEYMQAFKNREDYDEIAKAIGENVVDKLKLVARIAAMAGDAFRGWMMIFEGLKLAFAAFSLGVSAGLNFIYDKVLDINDAVQRLGVALQSFAGTESLGNRIVEITEGVREELELAKDRAVVAEKYWDKALIQGEHRLGQLAAEESYLSKTEKLLDRIAVNAKKMRKAQEEGPDIAPRTKQERVASPMAEMQAAMIRGKADIALALTTLNQLYKEGGTALDEYFAEREKLITEGYAREIALAEAQARAASNLDKKTVAQAKADALRTKELNDLAKLHQQKVEMEKKFKTSQQENAITLQDLRTRIMQEGIAKEQSLHEQEMLELQLRQEQEIQMLRDKHASMEQITEAHRLHELEQDKLMADQQQRILEMRLSNAASLASGLGDIFGQMYQDTGEEVKAFFYLQKAAAAAEALINAHAAASKALREGGTIMGPVLAAMHFAKAMVHVSAIRSQRLATGGEVAGYSPTPTSDNIPIQATAGEFMQPVSAVNYYGKGVMEALRRKMIPRDFFSGMQVPVVRRHYGAAFATGGPVGNEQAGGGEGDGITIVNTPDPQLMERYIASASGQKVLFNVIRENAYEVRQALQGDN